jgi:hypothetical protein
MSNLYAQPRHVRMQATHRNRIPGTNRQLTADELRRLVAAAPVNIRYCLAKVQDGEALSEAEQRDCAAWLRAAAKSLP